MRFVYWTATALIALVLVIFAVSNLEQVALSFEPLPVRLEAPLYLVVLVALALGFLLGEAVAFVQNSKRRGEHRALRRRIERAERHLGAPADKP